MAEVRRERQLRSAALAAVGRGEDGVARLALFGLDDGALLRFAVDLATLRLFVEDLLEEQAASVAGRQQ